jgi:hypothetical protein
MGWEGLMGQQGRNRVQLGRVQHDGAALSPEPPWWSDLSGQSQSW